MNREFLERTLHRYKLVKNEEVFLNQRKALFHAVCQELLGDDYDRDTIKKEVPYGSIIGIGNSYLDIILGKIKLFRIHAAYHDAFGYCKARYDKGSGYSYIIRVPFNSCFLGHVTGIMYWFSI